MSRARVWLLVGVPVIVLAAAAYPALRGLGAAATEVPTIAVTRGDFVRTVEAEGNLEAASATVLSAPLKMEMPIRIAWLAEDGGFVNEGDVVVRLDPTDLEKELYDGEADRDTANSKIEHSEVTRKKTLTNLDRDAQIAGQELEYARTFQSKDSQIFSRAEIIESEIDEGLAATKQEHAQATRSIQDELTRVNIDLLGIERRKAELKIQRAETGLQELELTAPHDGIFVLKEHWGRRPQVGQVVWRGNPIAEIPQLDEMKAEVFVLEVDGGGLAEGAPATVLLEAHPDRAFKATVKKVAALPTRRDRRVPVQYFSVTLELEETDPELMKPGQRVQASLALEELDDVLLVPRAAVFDVDGKQVVYRQNGRGFDAVEVATGSAALGSVVIESGVEEGDLIALQDPTRVEREESGEEPAGGGSATGGLY